MESTDSDSPGTPGMVDLRREVPLSSLLPLANELKDAYNRHRARSLRCPHDLTPGECEDPECAVVWIMES